MVDCQPAAVVAGVLVFFVGVAETHHEVLDGTARFLESKHIISLAKIHSLNKGGLLTVRLSCLFLLYNPYAAKSVGLAERRGEGLVVVNSRDSLGKDGSRGKHGELVDHLVLGNGNRVEEDNLLDSAVLDALDSGA